MDRIVKKKFKLPISEMVGVPSEIELNVIEDSEEVEMINIGDKVKDMVTDFEGIVVARAVYMNGCIRCEVLAKITKDGKPIEGEWIDETQLICKKKAKVQSKEKDTGGPCDMPSEFSHP